MLGIRAPDQFRLLFPACSGQYPMTKPLIFNNCTYTSAFLHWLHSAHWLAALCRSLLLFLLWLAVWQLGRLVEYTDHASVWYPVSGLSFAALLLFGISAMPALIAAAVVITLWAVHHYQLPLSLGDSLNAGFLFAMAHLLPYGLGAWLLHWLLPLGQRHLPKLIVAFLLIAASSSLLATALVLTQLVWCQMLPLEDVAATWLPFWIGDMAGVLVLAPFFIMLLRSFKKNERLRLQELLDLQPIAWNRPLFAKLLLNFLLVTSAMMLAHLSGSANSAFAIFFLVIPQMWLACTENAKLNVLNLALTSFLIAFWVHWFNLLEFAMVYQFAISVIAANTLFGVTLPRLIDDNNKLRLMAFTDKVTRVANREWLEHQAGMAVARAQRVQQPLSLMVFDVDHFKQINDKFGHQVGDEALLLLCLTVQQCLRPTDLLARFGGDEFVVLLPDTPLALSQGIAERIASQLRDVKLAGTGQLTASFGVTQWQHGETYQSLFQRADQALYQAKQQGRDRVAVVEAGSA